MGYEKERVYESAERLRADGVVLLTHHESDEKSRGCYQTVVKSLNERGIQHRRMVCDIFDMYDSLGKIGEVITDHLDDDVYVNLAAGSKITAIAGMIACMVTEATPYYVQVEDYESETPQSIVDIYQLPEYPIDPPEPDQINILYFLEDVGSATKGEIINFSERAGLKFISGHEGQEKAKYRLLDRQIVEPLLEHGYIDVNRDGRSKIVTATDHGMHTLRAFRYLITDQIANRNLGHYLEGGEQQRHE